MTAIDTSEIRGAKSIITLIVFVIANIVVIFPFHIPLPLPRVFCEATLRVLIGLRIIPSTWRGGPESARQDGKDRKQYFLNGILKWFQFPINFVTGPLIADLFLLAIRAIGEPEVYGGIVGKDGIKPYDILIFFFTLAYIAISIDASGLIRYLAFRVLQWGGKIGHHLFFYLYLFWFGLGSFIGNDPIILSGTAFLAYMTRVSKNIVHPRAWIHTQFAIANTASAILVSSNPTNLVLAGAFGITFVDYTRDMIVPVVITAITLFPFLLYFVFADPHLVPENIAIEELNEEEKAKPPVNPNIPYGRGTAGEDEKLAAGTDESKLLSVVEIMNPFLDRTGAIVGGVVMALTLVAILVLNATESTKGENHTATPVFYVTLPAAAIVLAFDLAWGWRHRKTTRKIAQDGRRQVAEAAARQRHQINAEEGIFTSETDPRIESLESGPYHRVESSDNNSHRRSSSFPALPSEKGRSHDQNGGHNDTVDKSKTLDNEEDTTKPQQTSSTTIARLNEQGVDRQTSSNNEDKVPGEKHVFPEESIESSVSESKADAHEKEKLEEKTSEIVNGVKPAKGNPPHNAKTSKEKTLVSIYSATYKWSQDTFPTAIAVISHLPFALLPFSFEMFILVQALANKGWVPLFAYGWDHWQQKTGIVGAIGGMGFLSVILCNFAGTNIGATILLSRVIQAWIEINTDSMGVMHISSKARTGTIYAMALGVNYGAYSITFNASLAGLLWRDILARKHIRVASLEFARINLPIIAFSMVVGSAVLVGEVYLFK